MTAILMRGTLSTTLALLVVPALLVFAATSGSVYAQTQSCPQLKAGDLFKVPNQSAVYLLNGDLRRMYVPHESVYFTWYDDFSAVRTIPAQCVDQYPIPTSAPFGISYRPGSQLVKSPVSPSVYVIEVGSVLKKLEHPAVAAQLYGENWEQKIRDVSDAFWPNYVTTSEVISQAIPHSGMLIRIHDQAANSYYVNADNRYRLIGPVPQNLARSINTVSESAMNSTQPSEKTVTAAIIRGNPAQGSYVSF